MAKVINLKPQEEITSAIERLWETGEEEVYLTVAKDSALLKNIIALKLLKREADRLGKEVILVTKDEVGREMAKRVGLTSRAVLPKKAQAENDEVFREVKPDKFETMLEDEVKARREGTSASRSFSDIRPKNAVVERHSVEIEEKEEKITVPVTDLSEEEEVPFKNEELFKEGERESFIERLQNKKHREAAEEGDEEDNSALESEEAPVDSLDESEEADVEEGGDGEEKDGFMFGGLASGRRLAAGERKPMTGWRSNFKIDRVKEFFRTEKSRPESRRQNARVSIFSGKFLGLFIGAASLMALLALYFILPKVNITVSAKTEAVSQDLSLAADKGISKVDAAQNKIPAQLIKLDKRQSREFATTGQRQVNDKARGMITIYNEYSSSSQTLVETTRFVSGDGKVFRLSKTITVPGAKIQDGKIVASSIEAEVAADQPGADYNIGPGRFTIPGFKDTPKYDVFYGVSKSAMTGGASGLMKVVSQEDYDKAKADIWQSLRPALDSEFKNQLPAGLKILEGAMKEEISGVEADKTVGSPAEKFTMTLKGTAVAVLFDENDVTAVIKNRLADRLDGDKDLAVAPEKINYQLASVDYSRGQVSLKIGFQGNLVWKINLDGLRQEIAGQNEKSIRDIFSRHTEISEAKVVFWPFWVKSAPGNLDKVIINEAK